VLLLVTINQRFKLRAVRIGLLIVAVVLLGAAMFRLITLPPAS
jgi:hypothetical protein